MTDVSIDRWDLLHLLLSVEDKLRGDQDQRDLDAVMLRTIVALDSGPPPPVAVPFEFSAPLMVEMHPLWIMETNAWLLLWPAAMVGLTILALNTLGDGLRDLLDQRMQRT